MLRDFKMTRVCDLMKELWLDGMLGRCAGRGSWLTCGLLQYNFRMNALAGNIPGVKKAAW